jgi:DNA-binding protein HU-beta
MNKTDLISAIMAKTNLAKKTTTEIVEAFTDVISEELAKGGDVRLVGFGTFKTKVRAERKGRNPSTGKEIIIPKTVAPAFVAGSILKEAVNKS